eukprot:g4139.t1
MNVICASAISSCVFRTPRVSPISPPRFQAPVSVNSTSEGRESREAGRMTYQPDSFNDLLEDACSAVEAAIDDGQIRLEVEFPPLPSSISGYKGSSDDFIDANAQLAFAAARKLISQGKRVMLLFPDEAEKERSRKMFDYVLSSEQDLGLGCTSRGLVKTIQSVFGNDTDLDSDVENFDCFVILNHSTIELPSVRNYVEEVLQNRVVILWNLELETLRSDLGLLGFPPRSLHFEFLSKFKSVFFVRLRDYSKTISKPPFLVNYSGALFREYPGPWQVMLREDTGRYVCIAEDRVRYSLFDVKEELLTAMGLDTEDEGSTMEFLRRGYKRSTWWEEDLENEVSKNWRI